MTDPSRLRVGVASVTVEHPGTHEPTKAQIDKALADGGYEGFTVVSGEYVSGGPSTLNLEPAKAEESTELPLADEPGPDALPLADEHVGEELESQPAAKRTAKKSVLNARDMQA